MINQVDLRASLLVEIQVKLQVEIQTGVQVELKVGIQAAYQVEIHLHHLFQRYRKIVRKAVELRIYTLSEAFAHGPGGILAAYEAALGAARRHGLHPGHIPGHCPPASSGRFVPWSRAVQNGFGSGTVSRHADFPVSGLIENEKALPGSGINTCSVHEALKHLLQRSSCGFLRIRLLGGRESCEFMRSYGMQETTLKLKKRTHKHNLLFLHDITPSIKNRENRTVSNVDSYLFIVDRFRAHRPFLNRAGVANSASGE